MNKRQRKKMKKTRNRKLVEKYPFLLPRNAWTGKVIDDYDYSFTEYDCLSDGWKKGFGKLWLEDLRKACEKTNFLNKLWFMQLKEKYGTFSQYSNAAPQEIHDVIRKYDFISGYICYECGSPESTIVNNYGWLMPMCKCCWEKQNKKREKKGYKIKPWKEVADDKYIGLPNEYKYTTFSREGDVTTTVDISETTDKIHEKYRKRGEVDV